MIKSETINSIPNIPNTSPTSTTSPSLDHHQLNRDAFGRGTSISTTTSTVLEPVSMQATDTMLSTMTTMTADDVSNTSASASASEFSPTLGSVPIQESPSILHSVGRGAGVSVGRRGRSQDASPSRGSSLQYQYQQHGQQQQGQLHQQQQQQQHSTGNSKVHLAISDTSLSALLNPLPPMSSLSSTSVSPSHDPISLVPGPLNTPNHHNLQSHQIQNHNLNHQNSIQSQDMQQNNIQSQHIQHTTHNRGILTPPSSHATTTGSGFGSGSGSGSTSVSGGRDTVGGMDVIMQDVDDRPLEFRARSRSIALSSSVNQFNYPSSSVGAGGVHHQDGDTITINPGNGVGVGDVSGSVFHGGSSNGTPGSPVVQTPNGTAIATTTGAVNSFHNQNKQQQQQQFGNQVQQQQHQPSLYYDGSTRDHINSNNSNNSNNNTTTTTINPHTNVEISTQNTPEVLSTASDILSNDNTSNRHFESRIANDEYAKLTDLIATNHPSPSNDTDGDSSSGGNGFWDNMSEDELIQLTGNTRD
ncbi:unnamed protein product [Ambrosiozyma monospora]|uniref:Unnamed protein product n=1 Tax=Ambrosiozyma monospora TaxID=43982 RepID=A0ACB5TLS2_AMBMO|nr:unnamed protein product [Ambrosiozyma monospora]